MGEFTLKTQTAECVLTIGDSVMARVGQVCAQLAGGGRVAVVTDSNVAPLYAPLVSSSLKAAGFAPQLYTLPAGEEHKTLDTVAGIYGFLAERGFTRSDVVVALGGGVVGDITGFAAATYLRGIRSLQIPTTLLAQVDSSVGGKCGVDLPFGKNLVGAFHQPARVLIDTRVLSTLPEEIFRDGMAEVIKYGCIFDASLFAQLEQTPVADILSYVVERCVMLKRDVVERDEHDRGDRMLLNFGHTIGHAIEKLGSFTEYSHGHAVAIGMLAAARLGEASGFSEPGTARRLEALLTRYRLAAPLPYPAAELLPVMAMDKKNLGGKLNLILLSKIGDGRICPTSQEDAAKLFAALDTK